jgi:phospholipid/cholesterol/gamma-HCH transport system substrate-binding protein
MKITGTLVKLGIVSLVLLFFTALIIVVFGQMRFDRTTTYAAEFNNVSGLRSGQFVRASGVEIGKVKDIKLVDGGHRVRVEFDVDHSVPLYQSTTAQVRYLNLIGDRYLELKRGDGEGSDRVLPAHGFIPLSHTSPALDLDALIGGSSRCSVRLTRTRSTTSPPPSSRCSRGRAAPSTTSSTRRHS